MLRYAVVGADGYARAHIERIREDGAELGCGLSAVAIRPEDRRAGQVERFESAGVRVFPGAVEMFDALAGEADGVFIPTGIHTHCELACEALGRGHNVYLEKPPAATVQELDRMLAAAADSGRICALGFQAISSRSINLIKQRVVSGELGEVRRLRSWALWWRDDAYYARNEWAGRLKAGDAWVLDGPSNNALAHRIADMLYLASPRPRTFATPVSVRAELYHARKIDSEDTSAIEIRTAEGPVACFVVSHCTAGDQVGPWMEVECSRGRACWESGGRTVIAYDGGRTERLESDEPDEQRAALANFTEAVRAGDPGKVNCDLAMGRNFTLAVNGAFESSGRTHPIDAGYVRRTGTGARARTVIEGINDAIIRCGREGKLYSDIGCEWAVRTDPFDLTGYAGFPRRFRASEAP